MWRQPKHDVRLVWCEENDLRGALACRKDRFFRRRSLLVSIHQLRLDDDTFFFGRLKKEGRLSLSVTLCALSEGMAGARGFGADEYIIASRSLVGPCREGLIFCNKNISRRGIHLVRIGGICNSRSALRWNGSRYFQN